MARPREDTTMLVRREDLRFEKSIASMKGMTVKDYFGFKIKEDLQVMPREIIRCSSDPLPSKFPRWNRR